MIVTVIGIEKFASFRAHMPNGIECDGCGAQVNFDRDEKPETLAHLRSIGWTGPMDSTKADQSNLDLCPMCRSRAGG